MSCRVKPISRTVSTLDFTCELNRPLNRFYVSSCDNNIKFSLLLISDVIKIEVYVGYRSLAGNYRQLINLKKIDMCSILENTKNFAMMKKPIMWLNISYPGLVHKCPYTVSSSLSHELFYYLKLFQTFTTLNASLNVKLEELSIMDWGIFPNGQYKMRLRTFDDFDENISNLTTVHVLYHFNRFVEI